MGGRRSFASRVRAGDYLVGTTISFADPALAELLAGAFDFIWIDLEHGALSVRDAQMIAVGAQAAGAAALVRVPSASFDGVGAVLDAGVEGIVAPKIETAVEVAALVRRLRYPPQGSRGFAPRRSSGYGRSIPDFSATKPVLIVQLETAAAVAAAREIAGVDGVDALFVGTSDLSLEREGVLAATEAVKAGVLDVQAAARDAGLPSGVAVPTDPDAAAKLVGDSSVILVASDVRIYAEAADRAAAGARQLHVA